MRVWPVARRIGLSVFAALTMGLTPPPAADVAPEKRLTPDSIELKRVPYYRDEFSRAAEKSDMPKMALHVYKGLLEHFNLWNRDSWASVRCLAKDLKVCKDSVIEWRRWLERHGWIRTRNRMRLRDRLRWDEPSSTHVRFDVWGKPPGSSLVDDGGESDVDVDEAAPLRAELANLQGEFQTMKLELLRTQARAERTEAELARTQLELVEVRSRMTSSSSSSTSSSTPATSTGPSSSSSTRPSPAPATLEGRLLEEALAGMTGLAPIAKPGIGAVLWGEAKGAKPPRSVAAAIDSLVHLDAEQRGLVTVRGRGLTVEELNRRALQYVRTAREPAVDDTPAGGSSKGLLAVLVEQDRAAAPDPLAVAIAAAPEDVRRRAADPSTFTGPLSSLQPMGSWRPLSDRAPRSGTVTLTRPRASLPTTEAELVAALEDVPPGRTRAGPSG